MAFSRQPLRFLVSVVLTAGLVLSGGTDGRASRPDEWSGEPVGSYEDGVAAVVPAEAAPAAWTAGAARVALGRSDDPVMVSGRVYEGAVGDEGRALVGAEVVLYGGNDAWPVVGTPVATTTTDGEGWWGLEVEEGFEFYQIRPQVPEGYAVVGATTVDGVVRSADWIEYGIPLEGKVLTGNTFWLRPPVLSGRVYEGSVGDERKGLEGVTVTLHCANDPGVLGNPVDATATDGEGWYGLWAYAGCEFYNVVETDPAGYVSAGATTVGGTVEGENWIQYPIPLEAKTLTGNKFWDLASGPGELADLRVTDLWRDGEMVCYQARNEGSGPAEAGHVTALYADGAYETAEPVEVELGTDEAYGFCFDWTCSGDEDVVEVWADVEGLVPEGDEGNNGREEVWTCDREPPTLASEIEVETGRDRAVVRWETNEPADGRVRYGATTGGYGEVVENPALCTGHAITLTGLSPATTYQGLAASADAAGNEVESETFLFETEGPEAGWGPVVGLEVPEILTGTVTIRATAEAEVGVEQVAFLVDGEVVVTDYAPPYQMTVDSTALANGAADLAVWAVDKAGQPEEAVRQVDVQNVKDATAPEVTITAPGQGASVSGIVTCTALITDDVGIVSARFYVDGNYQQFEPFDVTDAPKTATVAFPWDTRAVTDGVGYRLAVEVYDGEGKTGLDTVDVAVNQVVPSPPPSPPWLEVEAQTLLRIQNRFLVGLRVKNTGDFEARNVVIRHGMRGFQPIDDDPAGYQVLARYHPTGGYAYAEIRAANAIPAGESRIFFYNLMPVLMEPGGKGPEVGSFVDMGWDSPSQSGYHTYVVQPVGKTVGGETVAQAHASGVKAADYLIVTNPKRLFLVYNPGLDRNQPYCDRLLSTMAELAWEKEGALGCVDAYSAPALRNLIKQGGAWSSKMAPGWTTNGYLLLVGEQQIVPGWSRHHGTQYTTRGDIPFIASPTDYPYASTAGSELKPELAMGRIIGDTPALQLIAIRNSLYSYRGETGYDYDGLFALAANGFPACWHGGCDSIDFAHEVNRLPQVLSGSITGIRVPTLAQTDAQGNVIITPTKHAITSTFFTHAANKDIIFLAGHGNGVSWDVIHRDDVLAQSTPFGNHTPFVFASACATGDYPVGHSFGEAMLLRRASAFMGAVEIGACYGNGTCPHADTFFSNWDWSESFALALKETKQKLGTSFHDKWWTAIYHLYGDAKFGSVPGVTAASEAGDATVVNAPPDHVQVYVPEYDVVEMTGADGVWDHVVITGAVPHLVLGRPVVPAYRVFFEFPGEHQIQDVRLVHRGEPTAVDGLRVPTTTVALAAAGVKGVEGAEGQEPGWWPEEAFDWSVERGPATTTLAVTVYPFVYDAVTRRGLFFDTYAFEVDHGVSPVGITRLATDRAAYEPGEMVMVDLEVENAAAGRDVAVVGRVVEAGTGAEVAGLALRTLKGVEGKATYRAAWESAGAAPGSYTVRVELLDGPFPLDAEEVTFRLGQAGGVVRELTVPETAEVGEDVALSVTFENTGTVALTGTVVVEVHGGGQDPAARFEEGVEGIEPGEEAGLAGVWEDVELGDYAVVGYALFEGEATAPVSGTVRVGRRVYLPVVVRG